MAARRRQTKSMMRGEDDGQHHRRIPRMDAIPYWASDDDDDDEIDLKSLSELKALHIACCDKIAQYDPKKKVRVPTRFCDFNIAGFDLDKESKIRLGPRLEDVTPEEWEFRAPSSLNVISVKVTESDRGYPISVFGTVLVRDNMDYRCVYLFRREREDPQIINSKEEMLTLTGPNRGMVIFKDIFFEFNLKVTGDPDEDFSKGVIDHQFFCSEPITSELTSWLSTVELVFARVENPVAASLHVNILHGPPSVPFTGKISAGTRNAETHMILYDGRAMKGSGILIEGDVSVPLSRNLVVVPIPLIEDDEKFLVQVRFFDDDEEEGTFVTVPHPDEEPHPGEEHVFTHGSYEMQLKVTWTAIMRRPKANISHQRLFSLPRFYSFPDYDKGWCFGHPPPPTNMG